MSNKLCSLSWYGGKKYLNHAQIQTLKCQESDLTGDYVSAAFVTRAINKANSNDLRLGPQAVNMWCANGHIHCKTVCGGKRVKRIIDRGQYEYLRNRLFEIAQENRGGGAEISQSPNIVKRDPALQTEIEELRARVGILEHTVSALCKELGWEKPVDEKEQEK